MALRCEFLALHGPNIPPLNNKCTHRDLHNDLYVTQMVHAVEVEHSGKVDASVAYIAATPTTETNKKYVKRQLKDFLAGLPLEDFQKGLDESTLKGYNGELGIAGGEAGRLAMGYAL